MYTKDRNPSYAPWLDLGAFRIADPVERLAFLRREMLALELEERPRKPYHFPVRRLMWLAIACVLALLPGPGPASTAETFARERNLVLPAGAATTPGSAASTVLANKVWQVERSETGEAYSNGLRIDLTFAVSNRPRAGYPVFPLNGGSEPVRYGQAPAGIVYHTTESHLAAFEEEQNWWLKQLGHNLIENLRRGRSYNYVIDRFGRVFRLVEESDAANHAGHSVWADATGIYVNLNSSFLGIAFEAQTGAGASPAQTASVRLLTEMLRSRYAIPAENCVTHAQVSVNPVNMNIGQHVDWAAGFPFAAAGLPDNYAAPLASLWAFGFEYNSALIGLAGGEWKGLQLAEEQLVRQAAAEGLTAARYRLILQHRYKDIYSALAKREADAGADGS